MTEYRKHALCAILLFLYNLCLPIVASAAQEPDSVYTRDYITNICITDPRRALALVDEMEARHLMRGYELNHLRSVIYQNGFGMFRTALNYSLKAYRSDSIIQQPVSALNLLELIAYQYNATGNYTESTRYAIEGIKLAKKVGNKQAEANYLLCLGINKWDMRLKKQANDYIDQSIRLSESIVSEEDTWKKIDDLIYIYGNKITYLIEDEEYQKVIDLVPRMDNLLQRLKACADQPDGIYDVRSACIYLSYALSYACAGQLVKGEEYYKKYLQTDYASDYDGLRMRFSYLNATGQYAEVLRFIHQDKQFRKSDNDTINYIYLECTLEPEAQAYEGLGDYKSAAKAYKQMWILGDSLRMREKENGVLDFAALYETNEKEAQLVQQTTRLKENRMMLFFATSIILLLGFLLWRTIFHFRMVRAKNKAMVGTIEDLLLYKDSLYQKKSENLILKEQLQTMKQQLQKQNTTVETEVLPVQESESNAAAIDQALFDRVEHAIISQQLFLQPDFSREELMKIVYIPKNRFAPLFKQCTGVGFSKYINNLRLDYAARLLKNTPGFSIEAIARECGIPSQTSFYRLFSERFNMTPMEFRNIHK